jgi:hypothetical protein
VSRLFPGKAGEAPMKELLFSIYSGIAKMACTVVFLAIGTGVATRTLEAQAVSRSAVNKAESFLKNDCRGKEIMGFIYLGADYKGASYRDLKPVGDGGFVVTCELRWETTGPGYTVVALSFDSGGSLSGTRVVDTDAFIPSFYLASKSIEILGNALLDQYKDRLSEIQLNLFRKIVKAADAKSLMELILAIEQLAGQ